MIYFNEKYLFKAISTLYLKKKKKKKMHFGGFEPASGVRVFSPLDSPHRPSREVFYGPYPVLEGVWIVWRVNSSTRPWKLVESMPQEFQVIILAGGAGSNMHPLTEDIPKSLLPIANRYIANVVVHNINVSYRPLLSYQLDLLESAGFSSIWRFCICYWWFTLHTLKVLSS